MYLKNGNKQEKQVGRFGELIEEEQKYKIEWCVFTGSNMISTKRFTLLRQIHLNFTRLHR